MKALRLRLQLLLGVLTAAMMSAASASVLTYQGTCGPDQLPNVCANIGLSQGDSISALFELGTPGPDFASLNLGKVDVISFSFAIGAVSFTSADTTNWDFRLS